MIYQHGNYSYQFFSNRTGIELGAGSFVDFRPGYYSVRSDGARTVKQDYTTPEGVIRAIKKGTAKFVKEATNE